MAYNLTDSQKEVARWIINEVREGKLSEEFTLIWVMGGIRIMGYKGSRELPSFSKGITDALAANDLLLIEPKINTRQAGTSKHPRIEQSESSRRCVVTGKLYEAVDSNFSAPDTSFVRHLTPLADVTNLDEELKQRCLPILGAGSADPKLWDSAVRTAGVILEERLRDVGSIADASRVGRNLVNDVFGASGTLASKFTDSSELSGHRDLYAGVVGAFRNPSAHRFIDPAPEDGGALIVFINLLLKTLEDLR